MARQKTLKPIYPNAGIERELKQSLIDLIDEMQASIVYWLSAAYKANEPRLAMDALPAKELQTRTKKLRKRWQKKFDDEAGGLAIRFSGKIKRQVEYNLAKQMAVKFNYTDKMRDVMQATVGEQVGLIKSIAEEHLSDVEQIVMRSVANGRDLQYLTEELMKRYNLTKKRAAMIALDQNNKATGQIVAARQLELGITKAVWVHSGGGKKPRQSHVKAGREKLEFTIREGALIDGSYIKPGELINCRCVSRAILP